MRPPLVPFTFFFNDTATTEIYTLSLHDALPIFLDPAVQAGQGGTETDLPLVGPRHRFEDFRSLRMEILETIDRKSTRLNSSHQIISYAVFCLKKKKIFSFMLLNQYMFIESTLCC